ncbi:MAG: translocation/assembly module TamB domain-containing protein [Bacteroidales bacterium]|nr:translocation/assembly module TamB domain-containing protein [Bacteroidales bacterium]
MARIVRDIDIYFSVFYAIFGTSFVHSLIMGKNKKIYKIPLFTLLGLIALVLILFFTLRSSTVQTWLFEKFASGFSEKNNIELKAENIKFSFFNKIEVTNLLIKDNTSDTLLYSPFVKAGIRRISPKYRYIALGRLDIDNPVIKLRPDTSDILNLQSFAMLLVNQDTAKRNKDLRIRQLNINNGRLSYRSGNKPDTSNLFDPDNISLHSLDLSVDNISRHYSDIDLVISELSFLTSKGFEVSSLFSEIHIEEGRYSLIDPTIRTANSFINSDIIGLNFLNNGDSFEFTRDAELEMVLQSSLISLSDLAHFIEPLKGYDRDIIFSGSVSGTIEEMNGRDIILSYSDSTMLICDFDLSGLPDIDNTFMFIRVGSLTTTAMEIAEFELPGKGKLDPGKEFKRLGDISFSGNFTGFLQDFVTYGTINTRLGSVSTDILLRPDTSSTFYYKGTLQARSVQLGKILNREDVLGQVSARLNIEGSTRSFKNFSANVDAVIESLEFNDYTYRKIHISGLVTDKVWDGSVSSDTENLKMDLLGRFDFTGEQSEFDFSLNLLEADLYKLNIDRSDSLSSISMLMTANLKGNSADNINGDIRLLNSRLSRNGEIFDLYDCSINAFVIDSTTRGINLRTDYIDADLSGKYDLGTMVSDLKVAGSYIFPSLIESNEQQLSGKNNFDYHIRFKNTDRINTFFETGFMLSPGFSIKGNIYPGRDIKIEADGHYIAYNNSSLTEPALTCTIADSSMAFLLNTEKMSLLNRLNIENLDIKSETLTDTFSIDVSWENKGKNRNYGEISARGSFQEHFNNPRLDLLILPAELFINDKKWQVYSSSFIIDSTAITANRFRLSRNNDFFVIDGKISEDPRDNLNVSFNNLNLNGLNKLERVQTREDDKKINFKVGGLLNGDILISDVYDNIMFEADVNIGDFNINEHQYGNVRLLSEWDNNRKTAHLSLKNNIDGANTFNIDGDYDPELNHADLIASLNEIPLDILNIFLKAFASDIDGMGSGNVRIISSRGNLSFNGAVLAEQASMTVDYLQSNFSFSDSIRFMDNNIVFDQIQLRDNKNNNAVLNGFVSYAGTNNWLVDLRIDANNILAFDTRQKDNNVFYGTAYASGVITIEGPAGNLDFNISARTENNTRMFIPLNSGEEISDYPFISFKEPVKETGISIPITLPPIEQDQEKALSLNFELDVTPDAEVQLVFDSKVGDVLRARGTGTLNMSLDTDRNFSIFGDYVIEDGDYQLTLGNIFNKRFIVENGGTISWNGDIKDANIDIRAIYKLKASLEDLLQDDAYNERIPVECHLNMSGKLLNPVIGFDIYLPTADETTRTYLRDAIGSEEEMSRQFLYLLVMNSFYPAVSGISINTGTAGASAMGVTTTEMLSNQLSNWLSQISNDFDIGFSYRPGNEISSQEVEVALSTQLLNDRVIINGNFDVGGEQTSSSANEISGDFDVEVKITEKVRFRVFNRSNDNMMYETAPYTQGFGLFFRESFDSLGDLFKIKKSDIKREEETEIVNE